MPMDPRAAPLGVPKSSAAFSSFPQRLMGRSGLAGVAALFCIAHSGFAQSLEGRGSAERSGFDRGRNDSVAERPRPEYDAIGLRLRSFDVHAGVDVTGEGQSNVFATDNGVRSDAILRVAPNLDLRSNWKRHSLQLRGRQESAFYAKNGSENELTGNIAADGRLDIGSDSSLSAGLSETFEREDRGDPSAFGAAAEQIAFNVFSAYVGAETQLNRLRLSAFADRRDYNYRDGRTRTNLVIDQDFRDHVEGRLTGRAEYALSPDTAFLLEASGNQRNYDGSPAPDGLDRNSSGFSVLAGFNTDLSKLIRGEFAIGYLSQNYQSPLINDIRAFGLRGKLEWFVSPLTTITLHAQRRVEDTGTQGASSFLLSEGGGRVDYELRRNVLVDFGGATSRRNFRGIDRSDQLIDFDLGASYLANRHLRFRFGYAFERQNTDDTQTSQDYNDHRVSLTASTRF